jgi:hypothetical protein
MSPSVHPIDAKGSRTVADEKHKNKSEEEISQV